MHAFKGVFFFFEPFAAVAGLREFFSYSVHQPLSRYITWKVLQPSRWPCRPCRLCPLMHRWLWGLMLSFCCLLFRWRTQEIIAKPNPHSFFFTEWVLILYLECFFFLFWERESHSYSPGRPHTLCNKGQPWIPNSSISTSEIAGMWHHVLVLCGSGDWNKCFMSARQGFYHWAHPSSYLDF